MSCTDTAVHSPVQQPHDHHCLGRYRRQFAQHLKWRRKSRDRHLPVLPHRRLKVRTLPHHERPANRVAPKVLLARSGRAAQNHVELTSGKFYGICLKRLRTDVLDSWMFLKEYVERHGEDVPMTDYQAALKALVPQEIDVGRPRVHSFMI